MSDTQNVVFRDFNNSFSAMVLLLMQFPLASITVLVMLSIFLFIFGALFTMF